MEKAKARAKKDRITGISEIVVGAQVRKHMVLISRRILFNRLLQEIKKIVLLGQSAVVANTLR
jgi:hypothetical protein